MIKRLNLVKINIIEYLLLIIVFFIFYSIYKIKYMF